MLPKKNRADTKTVEQIFKKGKFVNSLHLTFKFIPDSGALFPRISFIAPKTVAKRAVERNLLRRRGYAALRAHLRDFPSGLAGVFIFRKYQDDVSILEHEIAGAARKIH